MARADMRWKEEECSFQMRYLRTSNDIIMMTVRGHKDSHCLLLLQPPVDGRPQPAPFVRWWSGETAARRAGVRPSREEGEGQRTQNMRAPPDSKGRAIECTDCDVGVGVKVSKCTSAPPLDGRHHTLVRAQGRASLPPSRSRLSSLLAARGEGERGVVLR